MPSRLFLLVDDDPQMAALVRILLRRAGHRLTTAPDAATASRRLTEDRPDLVLLDVNLPVTSGLDLLRTLPPDRPPVALFAQSGLADDIASGWDAGADYHLAKELVARPETWQDRLDEILSHLDGRPASEPISCPSSDRGQGIAGWWNKAMDRTFLHVPAMQRAALLRRAAQRAFPDSFDPAWVDTTAGRLDSRVVAPPRGGECLVEQALCMFGGRAALALTVALTRS